MRSLYLALAVVAACNSAPDTEPADIVYLNRCVGGCAVEPGADSAIGDRSSLIDSGVRIGEWVHGDEGWDELVECVRGIFRPYGLEITDADPGDAPHVEAMVAGDSLELGDQYAESIGIAPEWCTISDDVLVFSFANEIANSRTRCTNAAHEIGHAFGLEHTIEAGDIMSYFLSTSKKRFLDEDMACGEEDFRAECRCGGSTLNTHRRMYELLGPTDVPLGRPEFSGWSYGNTDTDVEPYVVRDDSDLEPYLDDPYGIERIDVYINGKRHPSLRPEAGLELRFGERVSPGRLDIELVAVNIHGASTTEALTMIKYALCSDGPACDDSEYCDADGRCVALEPDAQPGEACEVDTDCAIGWCRSDGERQLCAEDCLLTPTGDTCSAGFECDLGDTADGRCWPAEA
jgi:hypothetical protein